MARGTLGSEPERAAAEAWPPPRLSDLTYVPPGGTPPADSRSVSLVQLVPGESAGLAAAWVVYDVLPLLLERDLEPVALLPAGASVVWPLVAGITDDPALCHEGVQRLVAAGVRHVQPLTLALTPGDKRRLADRTGTGAFGALFHGTAPSERAFAALARGLGARTFAARPVVGVAGRAASNRRLAGSLALAGELWLRCGRGESEGQAFFRAARWVEETDHDVAALVREDNLLLVPGLADRTGRLLVELVETGRAALLEDLEEEYAGGGGIA